MAKKIFKNKEKNPKSINIKPFIEEWDNRFKKPTIKGKKKSTNQILRENGI